MTENQSTVLSPVSVLKRELGSKKVLAIAIIISLQAIVTIIDKISNRLDFSSVIGILESLLSVDLTVVTDIMTTISTIVLVLSLISVVPLLLLAIGFWFIFVGGKSVNKSEYVSKGVNLLHIYTVIQLLLFLLAALGSVIGVIIVGIMLMQLETTVGIVVMLVGLLIAAGIIALYYMYCLKIVKICFGIKYTLKTGKNMLYVYTFIVVMFWITGIYGVLSGFGSFTSFLNAALSASIYIMLAITLNKYKKEVGVPTTSFVNEQFKLYMKSPKNYHPEVAEGYTDEFTAVQTVPMQGGMPTMQNVYAQGAAQTYAASNSDVRRYAVDNSAPSVAAVRMDAAVSPINAVSVKNLTATEAVVIKVFPSDDGPVNMRFSLLGEKDFEIHEKCPITAKCAEIFKDSLSERKILRLSLTNSSGAEIKNIFVDVYAAANDNSVLAYMPGVSFDVGSVKDGEPFLLEYGVILPDETTNGYIKIQKVTFADGLYWDKGSEALIFSTNEKYEYDVKIFLSLTSN